MVKCGKNPYNIFIMLLLWVTSCVDLTSSITQVCCNLDAHEFVFPKVAFYATTSVLFLCKQSWSTCKILWVGKVLLCATICTGASSGHPACCSLISHVVSIVLGLQCRGQHLVLALFFALFFSPSAIRIQRFRDTWYWSAETVCEYTSISVSW